MAATQQLKSRRVSIPINSGAEAGSTKIVSVSMGKMSLTHWDADQALDLAEAIGPLLRFPSVGYLKKAEDVEVYEA